MLKVSEYVVNWCEWSRRVRSTKVLNEEGDPCYDPRLPVKKLSGSMFLYGSYIDPKSGHSTPFTKAQVYTILVHGPFGTGWLTRGRSAWHLARVCVFNPCLDLKHVQWLHVAV